MSKTPLKTTNSVEQTTYARPKGKFIVNSHYSGEITMSELIYDMLTKNIESKAA